jgi:hypothetical protein
MEDVVISASPVTGSRSALSRNVAPTEKVTVPVGAGGEPTGGGIDGATVAVRVTLCPVTDDAGSRARLVVVFALSTDAVTSPEGDDPASWGVQSSQSG